MNHAAKAATCTAIGWNAYQTCERCDYTSYVEIPALDHDYVNHEAKAATCTAIGWDAYQTCNRCDYTTYEEIAALDHDYVNHEAKAATCTAIGWDEYQTCNRCDYTTYEEIAALDHDYVNHEAKAATCTAIGWNAYQTCNRCDYTTYAEIAALNHLYVDHEAKAVTCTEKGWDAYQTCRRCDYTSYVEIPALDHDYVDHAAKTATCTEKGWDAYQTCSRCDYTSYKEIAALDHDYVNHEAKAATCIAIGWNAYKTCTRCDYTSYVEIPALDHLYQDHAAKAVTCTTIGWDAYQTCKRCDYTTYVEIPALDHDYVNHEAKAVTCTTIGWDAYQTCSRCDYTSYVEIPALTHDYVDHAAKAATCIAVGWNAYKTCSRCDYTTYEEIAALDHLYVNHEAQAETCTSVGWDAYQTCRRCDYTTYNEIPALGHIYVDHEAQAETCTTIGWDAYQTCERCDYTSYVEIAALGHDYVDHDAKPVTCTENGWNAYKTCNRCDYSSFVEIVAKGHSTVTQKPVAPTCTTTGLTEGKYCSICKEVFATQEVVDALGHDVIVDAAVAPTCTKTGLTEGSHCATCHEILEEQTVVAAIGHDMSEATCSAPATCKNGCGYTVGNALPHTPVADEGFPAMCVEPGKTDGSHCGVCGAILVAQDEIPALNHSIVQYDAKRPTYSSVGWNAYEKCSRCAYTTYEEIPALKAPATDSYEDFLARLVLLEEFARDFVKENPGKDPANLVIKYIRTGVERYNSGSWGIMAGYEDAEFAKYVMQREDTINSAVEDESQMICVTALKDLKNFTIPNGNLVDLGHMFGTMDITYHNKFGLNHADVAGWAGDLVDLLSTTDRHAVSGTLDEMVADISANYLCKSFPGESDLFNLMDMYGDLDGYYVMKKLQEQTYETGLISSIIREYFTETLDDVARADYFVRNRLDGVGTRGELREVVYNAYTSNKVVATLEGTRDFVSDDLDNLKKACCYAFADYLCRLAGDFVDVVENPYYSVFSSETTILAPGIIQQIKKANTADDKQVVFYLATADLTRDDVDLFANYNNNDPGAGWGMQRVIDQANAAQAKYGDPESEHYIENYNVIASTNGAGYNMQTGEPGGLLVMNGVEYHGIDGNGFFGILKDGTPVIGTTQEYNTIYKNQVRDGIAGFGSTLVKDGKVCINRTETYYSERASRTAVGITKTGKVVMMVMDGRQEPWSCGGSMQEIAQVMLEAGCVHAINLDGGGSTTYVAKLPGEEELSVVSRPSDGVSRSVSTSLIAVSTAPSSTKFDHAILESATDYLTVGSSLQFEAVGVSATGNATDLPEGTSWAVSNEAVGTITEDGIFTAHAYGEVTVYLMVGEEIVGSKVMHVVIPDQLYFAKTNINAVYGQAVELPVKALYDGKEVTVRASDLTFTLNNKTAGQMQGMFFIGEESSGIKMVQITAALAENTGVNATITVNLYKQGENSFDFDQATGGDRQLSWDRQVSNSVTDDGMTYMVVDTEQPMVTTYTFAIDMTQIPIPQRLEDLTYMLPGSDIEGASAWTFLMQLAERISVLSEVKPVLHLDPNFDVDYSDLKLVNEYFTLNKVEHDEKTNTLTLTLNWIDQTQPIDPALADPLCLVSGIKLTPKADAQWDSKSRLTAVNTGEIGYRIYLRASGLYSFAQKPENQEIFGLYPFVNPNLESEKGGYFGDIYKTISDTYTLINSLKNGWVNEDGGFAYYENGTKFYGIHKIDGLYYDLGENGINIGKTPYSGLLQEDGKNYYALQGELKSGWYSIGDDWYCFDNNTRAGLDGTIDSGFEGVIYEFDNGRLISGKWLKTEEGLKYYYGPYCYHKGWKVIDGEEYFFENYYAHTGVHPVQESHSVVQLWYVFDDDGKLLGNAEDGLYWYKDNLYYVVDMVAVRSGLYLVDGDYYYFDNGGRAYRNTTCWISNTRGLVEAGTYRFAEDGKMIMTTELVNENGTKYYYHNGKRTNNAGMIEWQGDYYYIGSGAIAVTDCSYWVSKTNGLVPAVGTYQFDAEGKMIRFTGIRNENGTLYYYKDGKRTASAGMIEFEGEYYYIDGAAKAVTNTIIWINKTNGYKPAGSYTFGADGKMIRYNGVVNGYYYVDGVKTAAGLVEFEGNYYYALSGGKVVTSQAFWITNTNGLKEVGTYRFDSNGRMIIYTGVVDESGVKYYYVDGKRSNGGVVEYEGNYYYFISGGTAYIGAPTWISKTNGLLTAGTYYFGDDGKIFVHTHVAETDGNYYYYQDGRRVANAGIVKIGEDFYFVGSGAMVAVDTTMKVTKTNGLVPVDTYTFGADGKMYLHHRVLNGYYYFEGKKAAVGLVNIDGDYYYARYGGVLVMDQTFWINDTKDMIPVGTYRFAADGKIIMTTEVVDENGTLYYYYNGKRTANAGVMEIDGSYYYIGSGAIAVSNGTAWVSVTNGLVEAGTYRFEADGKMVMTTEVVNENGTLYYYCNGKRTADAGLIVFNGSFYHIGSGAKAAVNTSVNVTRTNGHMAAGTYDFDENGRMILADGVVNGYYYENGARTYAGLVKVGDDYYYAGEGGELAVSKSFWVAKTNNLLPAGTYRFDAEGKVIMAAGLAEENGVLYYYRDGKRTANAGVLDIDGNYYYVGSGAIAVTNGTAWVSITNGLVATGTYRFNAEGHMILTTEVVNENGILYYYRDGKRTANAGLIEFEGAYYYIDGAAKAVTDTTVWINNTNGLMEVGSYTFGADGKMIF